MTLKAVATPSLNLLGPNDPPAVRKLNGGGKAAVIIICDHASANVPISLNGLGLDAKNMERHIAYDIGAARIAELLATRLDAPALLSGFSRLVIDINRPVDDFTSIRQISDGIVVPANRQLNAKEVLQRQNELYWPYHKAITEMITRKRQGGALPAIISIHSCTDKIRGEIRPWHIGVLMNKDRRMGEALMAEFAMKNPDLSIGDNKPYSGMDPYGYTIETHALPAGLPNVLLEIRQDLICDEIGQIKWVDIVGKALAGILSDSEIYTIYKPDV